LWPVAAVCASHWYRIGNSAPASVGAFCFSRSQTVPNCLRVIPVWIFTVRSQKETDGGNVVLRRAPRRLLAGVTGERRPADAQPRPPRTRLQTACGCYPPGASSWLNGFRRRSSSWARRFSIASASFCRLASARGFATSGVTMRRYAILAFSQGSSSSISIGADYTAPGD
jgi:hypothetical protein